MPDEPTFPPLTIVPIRATGEEWGELLKVEDAAEKLTAAEHARRMKEIWDAAWSRATYG